MTPEKSINTFTEAEIQKLPKWAQEKINRLERERNTAVRCLREWTDTQTVQPFSVMEFKCIGEQRGPTQVMRYIKGQRIKATWAGIELEVTLQDGFHQHDKGIQLQWGGTHRVGCHIAMIPESHQSVSLIHPGNLRK